MQIKLDHLIRLHLLKMTTLNKSGIHQNLNKLFSSWGFSEHPKYYTTIRPTIIVGLIVVNHFLLNSKDIRAALGSSPSKALLIT